ncbi:MAG TPA: PilZ domain-containing protein [Gemmataceae bacterium]|nr:PilZ domain-containing protein [Gemmataceae bacterium]
MIFVDGRTVDTDNRRQNYRHTFPPEHALPVAVQRSTGGPFWPAEALDLSVTGTRVRLENSAHRLAIDDRVVLRIALPPSGERLQMHGEVIHRVFDEHGATYGVQFLPSLNPSADEHRDRMIWQFLLAEQRRAIRRLHEELEPHRSTEQ